MTELNFDSLKTIITGLRISQHAKAPRLLETLHLSARKRDLDGLTSALRACSDFAFDDAATCDGCPRNAAKDLLNSLEGDRPDFEAWEQIASAFHVEPAKEDGPNDGNGTLTQAVADEMHWRFMNRIAFLDQYVKPTGLSPELYDKACLKVMTETGPWACAPDNIVGAHLAKTHTGMQHLKVQLHRGGSTTIDFDY